MQISAVLLLTLLAGTGITQPFPSDDSDLEYYFNDVSSEPVLSKRQWGGNRGGPPFSGSGSGGPPAAAPPFAKGGMSVGANGGSDENQQQPAPAQGSHDGRQGVPRSVYHLSNPAMAAVNGQAGVFTANATPAGHVGTSTTTTQTIALNGTATKTMGSGAASASSQSTGAPRNSKIQARQFGGGSFGGGPWWQHGGGSHKTAHANGWFSRHQWSGKGGQQQPAAGLADQAPPQSQAAAPAATPSAQGGIFYQNGGSQGGRGGQSTGKGQGSPQGQDQQQANQPQSNQQQQQPAAATPSAAAASASGSFPGSSGYMATVNKWRSALGKSALTQSSQLEANALKTANDGSGQMKHELNPGSMAQVLAPGSPNEFESVFVGGWLCERPNMPGMNGICSNLGSGWDHSDGDTGHADILTGSSKNIGCANGGGIWACDLS